MSPSSVISSRMQGQVLPVALLLLLGAFSVLVAEARSGTTFDATCYDNNHIPYIESIPHPTDCTKFYKCDRYSADRPLEPIPYLQHCSGNLQFSLETCNCEFPGQAVCFEPGNPEHEANRMKCACPLVKENGTTIHGDGDDGDKCAGIEIYYY